MGSFDPAMYGRMLYALRFVRGYKSAADLAEAISDLGVPTKEHTIWAIESGKQVAKVDRHLAFCRLLRPEAGYFEKTLS